MEKHLFNIKINSFIKVVSKVKPPLLSTLGWSLSLEIKLLQKNLHSQCYILKIQKNALLTYVQ